MGIRAKLILSTCIPLLIIYAAVLAWDYWKSRDQALSQIEQLVAQRASADASQVNGRLSAAQAVADRFAYGLATGLGGDAGRATTQSDRDEPPPPDPAAPPGPPPEPAGASARPELGPPPGTGAEDERRPPTTEPRSPGGERRFNPRNDPFRGERQFGPRVFELLAQTPWVDAVWFRFDATARRGNRRLTGGVRRVGDGFVPFTPASTNGWFDGPLKAGRAEWLEPQAFVDPALGPSCVFATPFYASQDATPSGVVCVSLSVPSLRYIREDTPVQSQLRQILGSGPTTRSATAPAMLSQGGYYLLDRKGRVLSRPDGLGTGTALTMGRDDAELQTKIVRSLNGSGEIVVAGGLNGNADDAAGNDRYVLALEPLSTTGWIFVTASPESDLLGPVQDRLIKRGIFLVGSLLVLVVVVSLLLTRFCRPIEQMAATVRQLAKGQLDIAPVPVLANDELGQLASGFNDMTGRLRHHVRELTEQSAEREKVEGELRIARQIQRDLLPRTFPPFPHRAEFDLHAVNIPARHIAGDFFDFFFTTDDLLTLVIADVSGKGVPAALMMAVTRTMVRNLAEAGMGPKEIVERVNRMLIQDTTPGLFVTMVLGQYEASTGRLTYVNAGHPPAICFCPGAPATTCCDPTGPLLGVEAGDALGPFEQQSITLRPGDGVLFYTDGVTEAHDQTNVMYGERRLLEQVTALHDRPTPDLCEGVVAAVMGHQHQSVADDITLVCLRRQPHATAGQ